jgi:mannose-6-phosphate isomerase-like protein (cupin superfamily)
VTVGAEAALPVQPFDVVHIPAGVPQQICNTGSEDLVFLCICTPRFRMENYRELEG